MKAKLLTAQKSAQRTYEKELETARTQEGRRIASRPPVAGRPGGGRSVRQAAVQPQSDPRLQSVAADYNQKAGLKAPSHTGYAEINVEKTKQMADAYDELVHDPQDPGVRKAYDAFIRQTKAQFDHAKAAGYRLEPWTQSGQPYQTSKEMIDDVRNNHHLWYFTGGDMPSDHPLAKVEPETGQTYNDLFRGVHDLYGHAKGGYEFGPRGEENAFLSHKDMYDDEAYPALRTETGQNAWVNYGSHLRNLEGNVPKKGEPGYVPPADRPFADQKAGILHGH